MFLIFRRSSRRKGSVFNYWELWKFILCIYRKYSRKRCLFL